MEGGYIAEGLKALLDLQLRESPALGVYPPLIEVMTPEDPNSPLSRYAVTLFLLPRASGQISLPALRLPWYDPVRGQLASVAVAGKTITVFDPRRELVVQGAAGLAGVLLLAGLIWQLSRMLRWRLARARGLKAIRQAGDVAGLSVAVRRFSLTRQPAAPSLGEWLRRVQQDAELGDVAAAVRQIEQARFGQSATDLAGLQRALVRALGRARPKARARGVRGMR